MKIISIPTTPLDNPAREAVDPARVVQGTPTQAFHILYSSPSGEFHAGIYECSIGAWRVSYSEDEFCTLLEGHVRLTDANGGVQEFQAPQSFLVPSGYEGTWEALTPLRKHFVIYEKTK